ncbi:MAG TPA: lasso peptide biosynthesis B2 protein [Croceicoccus sp.]|nr:lasso peptide biosynthesis B2 protein [Croceicoccus sp.]
MIRIRLRTLEAMAFLALARLLIRFVPLARWSRWLGESGSADNAAREDHAGLPGALGLPAELRACVAAVRRASWRLPHSLCLPQAIALQWMLSRRRIGSTIIVGFLPVAQRTSPDALHAWVEFEDMPILGDSGGAHASLLQFRKKF